MKVRKLLGALASVSMIAGLGIVAAAGAVPANAAGQGWNPEGVAWMSPSNGGVDVYRVYDSRSGLHHFTQSRLEYETLVRSGWNDEGVAFKAAEQGADVYRLYNGGDGQHLYTLSVEERDTLSRNGWTFEGVAWKVDTAAGTPVYRVYNPATGEHLWTTSAEEYRHLTSAEPTAKASDVLSQLAVSDYLEPGYDREEFEEQGQSWSDVDGNNCGTRDDILARDLTNVTKKDGCRVASGTLNDPYTGTVIDFVRGTDTDNDGGIQIDHVVALSNAWKSGASGWTHEQRVAYANDPYVLLAVDDQANQDKRDYAADRWLPSNTGYRCDYVARQIGIKSKYRLTVTYAERDAMNRVLATCPAQTVPAGVGAPSAPAPNPEPAPNPNPEPAPSPNPDPAPKPDVQYGIRPGAWCSPQGAIGYSAKGTQYVCRPSDSGKSLHWRRP